MGFHTLKLAATPSLSLFYRRPLFNPVTLIPRHSRHPIPLLLRAFSSSSSEKVDKPQWKAAVDFRWIRENKEAVAANISNRNSSANLELVLNLYEKMLSLQKEVERLRRERNAVANKMKGKLEPSERQKLIEEGKNLKEGLANLEEDLIKLTGELQMEAQCIPNMTHPDVPIGGEDCSALMYRKICNIVVFKMSLLSQINKRVIEEDEPSILEREVETRKVKKSDPDAVSHKKKKRRNVEGNKEQIEEEQNMHRLEMKNVSIDDNTFKDINTLLASM